jgi:hypothetical protein
MGLIEEQLVVGVYTSLMYLACKPFVSGYLTTLFVCGFLKHFVGYVSGLQSLYCKVKGREGLRPISTPLIVLESLLEGCVFVALGFLLKSMGIKNGVYVIAFTGHILAEVTGFHDLFIQCRCIK